MANLLLISSCKAKPKPEIYIKQILNVYLLSDYNKFGYIIKIDWKKPSSAEQSFASWTFAHYTFCTYNICNISRKGNLQIVFNIQAVILCVRIPGWLIQLMVVSVVTLSACRVRVRLMNAWNHFGKGRGKNSLTFPYWLSLNFLIQNFIF